MADLITTLAQAPMDLLNLCASQAQQTMNLFNMQAQSIMGALATPPAFPTGLPAMPMQLPGVSQIQSLLPPLPGASSITAPGGAAAKASFGEMATLYKAPPRVIV